jgi:long-subunit acyl-CoA synthetase (AMP-forming)
MTKLSEVGSDLRVAIEEALAQETLCAAFQVTAAANADRPALRDFGSDEELTWRDYADRVRAIATGLAALGVDREDAVGMMLTTRSEMHLIDQAVLHLGGVPFSIYHTNPPEKVAPLVVNAGARVLFTEQSLLPTIAAVAEELDQVEHVVVVDGEAGPGQMTLAELEGLPAPGDFDFEASWRAVTGDALAMIIYTSGTTGEPKGVEWTHRALLDNLRGLDTLAPVTPEGRMVSYLPMSHLLERFFSYYGQQVFGYTVTSLGDMSRLAEAIREVQPTRFASVPRLLEKLAEGAKQIAARDPETRQALDDALAAALERIERERTEPASASSERPAPAPALQRLRAELGMQDLEYLGSASAPARADVLAVFQSLGITVIENWGMTETGMTVANPPERTKLGTVGKPMPGVEAKLAEDGELLIRGPIFRGYRNDPERTRQAFTEDGWLRTGDVAAIDDDGYFRIIDRKKELIITSSGKNIAPVMVEATIKRQSPLIGPVVALGDGRSYLTALVVLDEDQLRQFAAERGLSGSFAELARSEEVHAEVARAIEAANQSLARIEQIKRFKILDHPWVPGSEELTSTMKLRRRPITARYQREIEELYS